MHNSHKVWITLAVFVVVLAFLAMTFFALSPKKMTAFAKQQQEMKKQQEQAQQEDIEFEDVSPAEMETEENAVSDELKTIDLEKEIEDDKAIQQEA